MKINQYFFRSLRAFQVLFVAILLAGIQPLGLHAQTTVNTTAIAGFSNNNGTGMNAFNIQNTNPFPIEITTVDGIVNSNVATVCEMWIRTTPLNAATLPAGSISVANGWTMVAQQSFTGITNTTTLTTQTMLTGISVIIPASTTYAMCIAAYSGTTGRLRYHTITGANLPSCQASAGGVNILMGNGTVVGPPMFVGFGSTSVPPSSGAFIVSRGFIGKITFNSLSG